MTYLAIAGDNRDIVCQIVDTFSKLGYKRNKLYTTSKIPGLGLSNYNLVTTDKIDELNKRNIIICTDIVDNIECYIPEPFGSTKYVEYATDKQITKLKEKYGSQIKAVYIGKESKDADYDLVIGATNIYSNMSEIMRLLNS